MEVRGPRQPGTGPRAPEGRRPAPSLCLQRMLGAVFRGSPQRTGRGPRLRNKLLVWDHSHARRSPTGRVGKAGGANSSTQGLGGPCAPDCGPQVQREGRLEGGRGGAKRGHGRGLRPARPSPLPLCPHPHRLQRDKAGPSTGPPGRGIAWLPLGRRRAPSWAQEGPAPSLCLVQIWPRGL